MTRQFSASISVGVHWVLGLSVTQPVEQLVGMLNRFQPDFLSAYPSMATRLAEEQLARRLRLTLGGMSTSSELRTPEMTGRIVEAFGVHPFDLYGTTEGLWGGECEHHQGIHLFEDVTLVENVDDALPVPAGNRARACWSRASTTWCSRSSAWKCRTPSRSTPSPARADEP